MPSIRVFSYDCSAVPVFNYILTRLFHRDLQNFVEKTADSYIIIVAFFEREHIFTSDVAQHLAVQHRFVRVFGAVYDPICDSPCQQRQRGSY